MVVHQALRNTVLLGNADTVEVERNASENRVRAGAEARAGRTDGAIGIENGGIGRVVEVGIEVPHAVVGFVGVRNAIPTQAQVEGQLAVDAPVVLDVSGPGNVVPLTGVLDGEFLIAFGVAKQEVGEVVAGESTVKAETALGLTEQILRLLVESPAPTELELVSAVGPREVITDLVIVGLVVPRPAGDFEVRAGGAVQVDVGDAVVVVRSSE